MTIDKARLKELVESVTTDRRFCADEHHRELATGVSALLAEISRIEIDAAYVMAGSRTRSEVIDQFKAENEKMRSFLAEVSRTSGDKWAVMAARNLLKVFGHD